MTNPKAQPDTLEIARLQADVERLRIEKQALQAMLQESRETVHVVLEQSPDAVVITDIEKRTICEVNQTFCDLTGYKREVILGRSGQDSNIWVELADRDRLYRILSERGQVDDLEARLRLASGEIRWGSFSARIVNIGNSRRLLSMVRDIEARKRTERTLRLSEERFSKVFQMTPDAININRLIDGVYLDCNPRFLSLTGYSREEIIGRTSIDLNIWADPKDRDRLVAILMAQGHCENFAADFRMKDGRTIPGLMSARVMEINGDACILSVTRNISEIKRLESERRRIEERLANIQKLESLGVLAGGIAHDFNNLLTAIAGNLDLAQLNLGVEHPEVLSNLRDAATAAIRARGLTHQLLTFAKGGKPLIELINAGPVVREAAALVMTGSPNRLECAIPEGLWPVWADAGQLSQVVGNLVINANHATSQTGTIFVEAANHHLEQAEASGLSEGHWVRVTVRDRGTGIAPEVLPKIFDPFFTTKSGGSGLGLSSAHSIVLAHGGTIDVHSKVGEGARFTFYLPAEPEGTAAVVISRSSPAGLSLCWCLMTRSRCVGC
jgi:two-component system cell cycle sensor histidine kinase/response regulator CckA